MEKTVLNMPLRKVHALEIVKGKKEREFRAFSDYWARRLCIFDTDDPDLAVGIKSFDRIHFYPYNNKWHVDCELRGIEWVTVDAEFLKKYAGEVTAIEGNVLFVFHLGKVVDTNLE